MYVGWMRSMGVGVYVGVCSGRWARGTFPADNLYCGFFDYFFF